MNSTLQFDLQDHEQKKELLRCVKAAELTYALLDMEKHLRGKIKYVEMSDHDLTIYEDMRKAFHLILEAHNINLDELM